jgi:hypothetical protein
MSKELEEELKQILKDSNFKGELVLLGEKDYDIAREQYFSSLENNCIGTSLTSDEAVRKFGNKLFADKTTKAILDFGFLGFVHNNKCFIYQP